SPARQAGPDCRRSGRDRTRWRTAGQAPAGRPTEAAPAGQDRTPQAAAPQTPPPDSSRVAAVSAQTPGLDHPSDPEFVCSDAQRYPVVPRALLHLAVGTVHPRLEPVLHVALVPAEALKVLSPFEVGDDNAAGIGENIWHD